MFWAYDRKKADDDNDGCNGNYDGNFDNNDDKNYQKTYKCNSFKPKIMTNKAPKLN